MNFYQRANLSLALAVVLGFEVALISGNQHTSFWGFVQSNKAVLPWVLFQLLFKYKTVLDDHNFFETEGFKRTSVQFQNSHFLMLLLTNTLQALAAATSRSLALSMSIFIVSITIASIWVYFDRTKTKNEEKKILQNWLVANFMYVLLLMALILGFMSAWFWFVSLFIVLVWDYRFNGTNRIAPKV